MFGIRFMSGDSALCKEMTIEEVIEGNKELEVIGVIPIQIIPSDYVVGKAVARAGLMYTE